MARWRTLARKVDTLVDFWWGELVVLRPWLVSDYSAADSDPSRPVTAALACPISAQAAATALGGPSGAGFIARETESRLIYSIRREPLELCGLKKGDRVELPEHSLLCEVAMVHADNTSDRPYLFLTRLVENPFNTAWGDFEASEAPDHASMAGTVT